MCNSFNGAYKINNCRKFFKMALTELSANCCFEGWQKTFSHTSKTLGCTMKFAVYLPPQVETSKVPVLYWLSGLECNETNFIQKAGAQRHAAEHGVMIVCPDTSPRGLNLPKEDESWDFGTGAGFYVDATEAPWKDHYNMFSYVTKELVDIVCDNFPVLCDKQGIFGHSMGGHGALICALKCPGLYKSVSAFAPICNPSQCPWGKKAFSGYLGPQETGNWNDWDATELVKKYNGPPLEIFIDQGLNDKFLTDKQLLPENFLHACKDNNSVACLMKSRLNYDHGYYYISTFVHEHFTHHMKFLKQ